MYRFMLHMYMQVQVLTILFYILAPRPLLNTITKDEFNMETQVTVNVPEGLRSICYRTKLWLYITIARRVTFCYGGLTTKEMQCSTPLSHQELLLLSYLMAPIRGLSARRMGV